MLIRASGEHVSDDATPEDIGRFSCHLNELKHELNFASFFHVQFILKLKVYDWKKNPFTVNTEEADTTCHELLEIEYDEEIKRKFDGGGYESL
ncbi:hypothetical protein CEXT_443651 [Caerostris extrusa]|uniref:Uncharacterized protein n=1 Tax=Caerostris extrusa TaxID=172846 RepID=A0AAV4XR65_CAEEX|nr:hypothetical protein CEXT_443651 [Caerostris extrusa]